MSEDHKKSIDRLNKVHIEALAEKQKEYMNLQQDYTDLKMGKIEKETIDTLTKQIVDLENQLEKEKNKKWYQRF